MCYVYILVCSDGSDGSNYVGCTSDLKDQLGRHNSGQVSYTKTRLPVILSFYAAFPNKYKAFAFEKYLKSGCGRAFTKKHLL
jgi:putative endonuclease